MNIFDVNTPHMQAYSKALRNEYLYLDESHAMHNKIMVAKFKLTSLPEGAVIRLGHGESCYGGTMVDITDKSVGVYHRYLVETVLIKELVHGLSIEGEVEVSVKVGYGFADVCISLGEDEFAMAKIPWMGRNGRVFMKAEGVELEDVSVIWHCFDLDRKIWLMGDSYFSASVTVRWPYYLIKDGYTEHCFFGYPGRTAADALADFKRALKHGTPKYAVWCMGMNDPDQRYGVSAGWKKASDEFVALCNEKGITPILSTAPNVPDKINVFKNRVVAESGCRYIDFAAAVGAEDENSCWIEGMLASDMVHPAQKGAKALYGAVLKDFPEIMER